MGTATVPRDWDAFLPKIGSSNSSPVMVDEVEVHLIEDDLNFEGQTPPQNTRHFPTLLVLTFLCLFLLGGGTLIALNFLHTPSLERCDTPTCHQVGEEIRSFMDPAVNPCNDFYHYACGGWIQLHPAKPEDNATSALSHLTQENTKVIRNILESSQVLDGAGEKARNFYISCLNKKDPPPTTTTEKAPWASWKVDHNATDSDVANSNQDDDWWTDAELSQLEKTFTDIRSRLRPYLALPDPAESKSLTCATVTIYLFPDVAGRLFVAKTFSLFKKTALQTLLSSILSQYRTLISATSWIDPATKTYLNRKLSSTSFLLGYPSTLLDTSAEIANYAAIPVSREGSSYPTNLYDLISHSILDFIYIEDVDIVRIVPQANAFYTPVKDTLVIPAGIVMPPFFSEDPAHPELVNWAKLATSLGHEVTHAFEEYFLGTYSTRGQQPKGVGLGSYQHFGSVRTCLVEQYEAYRVPNSSVTLNGKATWDENLADVLGLQVAYQGYFEGRKSGESEKKYKILPGLEGLNPEQVFFVGAAQVMCKSFASEEVRQRVLADGVDVDPHSPNSIRVRGQMSNNEQFAKAFNCPVGSVYNPEKKCKVFF